MKRHRPILLILLLALLVPLPGCHPGREYEALLVVSDIAAGTAPTRLKATTAAPRRFAVAIPTARGSMAGDLYLSDRPPLAGLLLLPGAAETGKDDPRLVALAQSLARARFAVLVPDLAGLRSMRISSRDIGETADAFDWLATRKGLALEGRCGIFAFSYASGPAILAALEPKCAGRVRFIMTVGAYHSSEKLLTFFTTGYYRRDDRWHHRTPNAYGKWIFVLSNVAFLSHPFDRELFRQAAQRKMADLNAPLSDLVSRLSPEGKAVYDFVENRDPNRVRTLLERLPEPIRREIGALDISARDLGPLDTRFILVHGYDDDIIPYTESVALSRALGPDRSRLYLVHGLMHVTLKPGIADRYRLWRAVSQLLRQREKP